MISLERASGPFDMKPLQWRPVNLDGQATAFISCSNGHGGYIAEHEIAPDGTVSPSVECAATDCDFHENNIRLEGWAS